MGCEFRAFDFQTTAQLRHDSVGGCHDAAAFVEVHAADLGNAVAGGKLVGQSRLWFEFAAACHVGAGVAVGRLPGDSFGDEFGEVGGGLFARGSAVGHDAFVLAGGRDAEARLAPGIASLFAVEGNEVHSGMSSPGS